MTAHPDFEGQTWAVGSVRGVRAFGVDPLGRLHGVTYKQVWKPGENLAECDVDVTAKHSLLECGCGFHAYNSNSADYETGDRIAGVVEGYGKTVLTEKGFRASKARILALYDPTPTTKANDPDGWRRGKPQHWGWFWALAWIALFGISLAPPALADGVWWSRVLSIAIAALAGGLSGWNMAAISRAKRRVFYTPLTPVRNYHDRAKNRWLRTGKPAGASLSPELIAKVRRNYPGVPWYTDRDEMLADFPPDTGPEPSPETMPDFWDRPVKEGRGASALTANQLGVFSGLTIHSTALGSYYGQRPPQLGRFT